MVAILFIAAKLATKIKLFWNKSYDNIISVYDVITKILSCDSNYFVKVVRWLKFVCISVKEAIITWIL